jgi:predicted peptidase
MARGILVLVLVLALAAPAAAQQQEKSFEKEITVKMKLGYLLFLPEGYDKAEKSWPLLVFLHGAGETGTDLKLVKKHGPAKIVENKKDFPFVVLSPQTPTRGWNPDVLVALIDDVAKNYKVDRDRIYLTGLSMGGFGTFATAAAYPDRFAAIAPICGGGDPTTASKFKQLPCWVFHGVKDRVVPIAQSERMVKALEDAGGKPKFTKYPEADHDSWTVTYDNPELYKWFLEHKREAK